MLRLVTDYFYLGYRGTRCLLQPDHCKLRIPVPANSTPKHRTRSSHYYRYGRICTLAQTTKQTSLVMHLWTIPPIIGTAVIYGIPPTHSTRVGLLIAFYCTQFYLAEGNMIFSLISRNLAGRTKKSTSLAMTFVAWAAGNMTAPQVC